MYIKHYSRAEYSRVKRVESRYLYYSLTRPNLGWYLKIYIGLDYSSVILSAESTLSCIYNSGAEPRLEGSKEADFKHLERSGEDITK